MAATYIVDGSNPQASDENPGTEDKPFKTISRAVKDLKPGDAVMIKAGEYREAVTVQANGTTEAPIVIKAFSGHEGRVVVKGSDIFTRWEQLSGNPAWSAEWRHQLDSHYPKDRPDFGPYAKRCEVVFVEGQPLQQVFAFGLLRRGTFFVDEEQKRIWIALHSYALPKLIEVAVRQRGFFVRGSYIHLKGITVMHVANPHDEAAFHLIGTNIVIEDCRAEWNNLDGFLVGARDLQMRRCVSNRNGRCGISASTHDSIFERCVTNENSWRFGPFWHAGGMKVVGGAPSGNRIIGHVAKNNNGKGIWFDYGCRGNRVERCFLHGNLIAGLEFEACLAENWVINNIICHNRIDKDALTEHGTGAGILLYTAHRVHIYHNTIVGNERFGILIAGGKTTIHYTKEEAFSGEAEIVNNIIAGNGFAGLGFWVWEKSAEPEILASHRSDFNLWWQPNSILVSLPYKPYRLEAKTLDEWQKATGQDIHSLHSNPVFLEPDKCTSQLKEDSPAIDRGKALKDVAIAELTQLLRANPKNVHH